MAVRSHHPLGRDSLRVMVVATSMVDDAAGTTIFSRLQLRTPLKTRNSMLGPHPRIPHMAPFDNTELGHSLTGRATTSHELSIFQASLLAYSWTLLSIDEAVEFALNSLRITLGATLSGKLFVESIRAISPFFIEINAVIPDEVHFFIGIFGSGCSSTLTYCGR